MFFNLFSKGVFSKFLKLKISLLFLVFLLNNLLLANIHNVFSEQKISKTQPKVWFEFEPDEGINFKLEGSDNFISSASSVKFYPSTSVFFKSFDKSENSLGVRLSWDRVGSHYADIIPELKGEYLTENTVSFSIWVWSPRYKHTLAAIFKRQDGYSYSLEITKLDFKGWKRFDLVLPEKIRRDSFYALDVKQKYFFDRFRVYTDPMEKVGNVFVFLDKMIAVEELYTTGYDGYNIEKLIRDELYNKENSSSSENGDGSSEQSNSEN